MSNLSKLAMTLGMKFGPVRKGVTPRRVLEFTVNSMVMIQADNNITTDPSAICRHEGMLEAYKNVAHFIAPYTNSGGKTVAKKVAKAPLAMAKNGNGK